MRDELIDVAHANDKLFDISRVSESVALVSPTCQCDRITNERVLL